MEKANRLAERITRRLAQHKHALADRQQLLDSRMQELLEQRERLADITKRRVEMVIRPRVEELKQHFSNGSVDVQQADADCSCVCQFSHTLRFPATVSLVITLSPRNIDSISARYSLNILPSLMEYTRNDEAVFPLDGGEEALADWVEDRIIDFIDTYLQLETHPLYQKDNTVVDIVCGMHIPATAATNSIEWKGHTYYFCSEHCKDAFIKKNS